MVEIAIARHSCGLRMTRPSSKGGPTRAIGSNAGPLAFWAVVATVVVNALPVAASDTVSLAGRWRFQLDPRDVGRNETWFAQTLSDTMDLPGTTDQAGKGYALDAKTMRYPVAFLRTLWPGTEEVQEADRAGYLVRPWYYVGKAWYQREIEIPPDWQGKMIHLALGRVIWKSDVWINDRYVGDCDSLVAEHQFDLGLLQPGTHVLTIRVDNGMVHNIGITGHAYGPETQSRWNGIVGRLDLTATSPLFIRRTQAYPNRTRTAVHVAATIVNATGRRQDLTLDLEIRGASDEDCYGAGHSTVSVVPGEQILHETIALERPVEPWDEHNTRRYRLVTRAEAAGQSHQLETPFGFRHIVRDGRRIVINNRRVFLRGTLDCCVYPRTGYPPTTVEEWLQVLGVIKDHGFNHVRYHSWCPPEAAFEAADQLGLYLAPETPFWVDGWITGTASHPALLGNDPDVLDYVRREIRRIADAYGNHPSFAFFCIGNEFGMETDWGVVDQLLADAKKYDPRRLYNACTTRRTVPSDDYWVTAYVDRTWTRGIGPPHTNWDFSAAASKSDLPIVSHETGQRPVFPDYDDLLQKFTGPLKPYNLLRLRDQTVAAGLADQVSDFEFASARFQHLLYKAEHEGCRRTGDFAGYQLLMLNDFTGQSEALVGVLDPFWETKGVISPARVRQWNSPTVPLARFDRYTWRTSEVFTAAIEVSHYGPTDLVEAIASWSLAERDGNTILAQGELSAATIPAGQVTRLGEVQVPLSSVPQPAPLTLHVSLGEAANEWTIWAYPPSADVVGVEDIVIAQQWNDDTRRALKEGRRVLLLMSQVLNPRMLQSRFAPVYWSAGWSPQSIATLGVMCDPQHPALASFPNDGHSDWQWQDLVEGAVSFVLDDAPQKLRPIVQSVPDFHQNHLLGSLFETRYGAGRLLVCGFDLANRLEERPVAAQLRRSILDYMNSSRFAPTVELPDGFLTRLLASSNKLRQLGAKVRADSEAAGYGAELAIDGNLSTIWHTQWLPEVKPLPHEFVVSLPRTAEILGIQYVGRGDQTNGRIARYEVYASREQRIWGAPVASGVWSSGPHLQTAQFSQPVTCRYVKIVALSEVAGEQFSSAAEFDVILHTEN